MNSIILSGGKNKRMLGVDKAFLKIGGRAIISGIIEELSRVSDKIIIVTNNPQKYERIASSAFGKTRNDAGVKIKLVLDDYPGMGPLAAVYSGLKVSDCKYNFITACDMPFSNTALIKHMFSYFSSPLDICVTKIKGIFHPLCGVYSKACVPEGSVNRFLPS